LRRVFCEELSTVRPLGQYTARIIRRVTAVEGKNSGNKTATKTDTSFQEILQRLFLVGVVLLAIVYGVDLCVFRYRLATKRQPFGSVTVEHYDAVLHKDGKSELIFDPPVQQTCVHSLFPHVGDPPCWYLSRHAEQRTEM
jgi:hypothetical protein